MTVGPVRRHFHARSAIGDRAALDVTGHRRIPQCQLKGIEPGVLQVTQTSHSLGCLHAKREIHDLAESLATGGCVAEEAPPNQPD